MQEDVHGAELSMVQRGTAWRGAAKLPWCALEMGRGEPYPMRCSEAQEPTGLHNPACSGSVRSSMLHETQRPWPAYVPGLVQTTTSGLARAVP